MIHLLTSSLRTWFQPRTTHEVVIYTRPECRLCDDAKQLIERHGREFSLEITEINVETDPEYENRFGECVPVVWINGKQRFRGRINPMLLRRLLRAETRNR